MRHLNKKLCIAATATALIGAIGASFAQTDENAQNDPMASPQKVEVNGSGQSIYFLRDQGNSPESDPSAHLMLLKHPEPQAVPVAETTTTTTTVAQTTTAPDTTTAMPAASDTSNTEAASDTMAAPAQDDTPAPALAPKADRN